MKNILGLKMSKSELACVYAALILADDDVPITGEKIETILKASGVEVEPYWPGLFAKALQNCNVKDLITKIGPGMGASIAQNDEKHPQQNKKTTKWMQRRMKQTILEAILVANVVEGYFLIDD